ncbi:hypothetical protein [Reichenbachiella sp.]|uniref:hypothetical protein n=1 Tax=Reichenbachiella sp. TaxID=2184521 RepID=UPI003BAFD941
MKKIVITLIVIILGFEGFSQNEEDKFQVYQLFPTQNMYTFLKLDTKNGYVSQVQFSMELEGRFESQVNFLPLVTGEDATPGRFTLYPTQNIYTFILLDQINGQTYQVQWSQDHENRFVIPIEKL